MSGTAMGRDGRHQLLGHPAFLSSRYQEVQAAQKALGVAVAEALPGAERVLAAVQQVGEDAALRLASPAAPVPRVG